MVTDAMIGHESQPNFRQSMNRETELFGIESTLISVMNYWLLLFEFADLRTESALRNAKMPAFRTKRQIIGSDDSPIN
jgi:hypothetical protein